MQGMFRDEFDVPEDTNPVPSTLLNFVGILYHRGFVPVNSKGPLLGKKLAVH